MTTIEQEIIANKQRSCDLIESGIIRASGALVKELNDAVEDESLTLAQIRLVSHKLVVMLDTFDDAQSDLEKTRNFYEKESASAEEKFDNTAEGAVDDNHQ